MSGVYNLIQQSLGPIIPKPTVTEKNCPDQAGRVHIVTGGYGGLGFELAKILYQHNATLYLAGRSADKMASAISTLQSLYPDSKGRVSGIIVDFSDLTTIAPAVTKFRAEQSSLHVLTLNHGVMFPPKGATGPQGFDLSLVTNCLGSYLFYDLLRPSLLTSAQGAAPASVRVTWASSTACDLISPKPGGVKFTADGAPAQDISPNVQYGQTKAGNTLLAAVLARRDAEHGIMHLSWNPGNLTTDLPRHMPAAAAMFLRKFITFAPIYGAYTELYAALGEVPWKDNGAYIQPWGKVGKNRPDIEKAMADKSPDGVSEKFVAWLEAKTKQYA